MSRELKFRAWDGDQMHYDVVPWRWDFVIDLGMHKCVESTGSGPLGSGGKTARFEVNGTAFKEIMQFTGLHDRNGKPIYEGDILSAEKNCLFDQGRHNVAVEFMDGSFVTSNSHTALITIIGGFKPEVIGNVYEHSHLLKGDQP